MKVQITNGYIMPAMTTPELLGFSKDFRRQIRVLSKELVIERLGNMCMGYLDFVALPDERRTLFSEMNRKLFLNKKGIKQSALFTAYEKMQEMEQRIITEKIKKPEYDFLCDLIMFPTKDYTLVMLFAEQEDYIKAFKNMPGVKDYPYWDNKDLPGDVTRNEWDTRKSRWESAMGETGIPSLEGLSVSCYTQLPFIDPEVVHDYLNERFTMDVRVNNYAGKIVVLDKYWEVVHSQNQLFGTEEMYKDAAQYLRTEDGQLRFREVSADLEKLFIDSHTVEDLSLPLEGFVNTDD